MLFLLFTITFQLCAGNIKAQQFRMDYMYATTFQTYYSLHDLATNWDDAVQTCTAEGTELLKPESLDEMENLKILMSNMRGHYEAIFIGLHDKYSSGDFVTLKGEPIVGTYLDLLWAPGSPNNESQYSPEHCVVMSREGLFDDKPCNSIYPFVCKIFKSNVKYNEQCDNYDIGYVYHDNGKCYKFHEEPLSWHDAFKVCEVQHGNLAIINSIEEAALITSFMNKHLINKSPNPNILLIGFSDLMFQYEYRTVKSQTLEEANYSMWAPFTEEVEEMKKKRCGAVSRTGEIVMTYCDLPSMFVCEKQIYSGVYSSTASIKSLEQKRFTGSRIPNTLQNTLFLVHTQEEKETLSNQGIGKGKGSRILTIHEAQGLTYETVIGIKTKGKLKLHDSVPHAVVAVSRHTRSFTYYADDEDDAISRFVRSAMAASAKAIIEYNIKMAYKDRNIAVAEALREKAEMLLICNNQ